MAQEIPLVARLYSHASALEGSGGDLSNRRRHIEQYRNLSAGGEGNALGAFKTFNSDATSLVSVLIYMGLLNWLHTKVSFGTVTSNGEEITE